MNNRKESVVISFISGKGGVGKTALTVATGKLLSMLGYKVLLIDSDLITHGMTFLLGFDSEKGGILETYECVQDKAVRLDELQKQLTCKLAENLDFIQSSSRPSRKYSSLVFSEIKRIDSFFRIIFEYISETGEYDFILVDSQAGSVPATFSVVENSTKTVIVMEPDPVSTYATQNVVSELGDALPKDSFYVINKLYVEEASGYIAIERFLKILRHLPPIPFDFEVRRCFMTRQIPIDKNKPSAFMFAIMRMVRDLLPETERKISELEEEYRKIALGPTEEALSEAEKEIEHTIRAKSGLQHELGRLSVKEIRYSVMHSFIPVLMIFLGMALVMMTLVLELNSFIVAQSMTVFIGGIALLWYYLRSKKVPVDKESSRIKKDIAVLQERIDNLRRVTDSYRNLLITRSKELMLGTDIKESY